MSAKIISIVIRLIFAILIILTSFYCLLAYPPFTYQQVIKLELVTWLAIFVKIHPYIYLTVSVLLNINLLSTIDFSKRFSKYFSLIFVIGNSLFSIALIFNPLLSRLENSFTSLFWCFITSLPLFYLILINYFNFYPKIIWPQDIDKEKDKKIFLALLKTSIFVSLLYFVIFQARLSFIDFFPTISQEIFILIWSLSAHLVVFMAIFLIFNFVSALAKLSLKISVLEFWLVQAVAIILVCLVFRNLIFAAIGFNNYLATFFAFVFATLLVTFFSSISILLAVGKKPFENPLELLLCKTPFNKVTQVFLLLILGVIAYVLTTKFVALDWNFLLQKIIVLIIWLFVFICFYSTKPNLENLANLAKKSFGTNLMLVFALLSLISYKTISILENQLSWQNNYQIISGSELLDKYAGYDISVRLLKDIFNTSREKGSFYKFLQSSSNIAQEIKINPVEIDLVENFTPKEKPNIFIFTIDSLRQDYVGAYNRSVKFTPFIDAFASESIVMENSFSHYGGTGLSEPSIWVGGLLLHKQYVTPFYPMNSLEKLLEKGNYQSFISMDSILETIVKPSSSITQIDKGVRTQSLEFCKSLDELKDKITNREDKTQPMFAYTQPQNIHISVINRQNRTILDNDNYDNFYAPYASRVKEIDRCFGDFIKFLKSENLFENSIIIFTSDHGDSLGEEGRFGHAYTIFPEILKIPLIIHLPNKLLKSIVYDSKTIAFSSDITPSLYYLVGDNLTIKNEIFGRPLFTKTIEEQKAYLQDSYLVASSYGAVYGLLTNNGKTLYIADGVNFQDYFYDLINDPRARNNLVNPLVKKENETLIRGHIERINNFYHFVPKE
ncbi:MAG: sulfatase-like hydrolase/transferase [Acidobacteria bacterium]|nr:sulfatase-like hydrolase/transferase [Acidobacteriota bacterium]